MLFRSHGTSDRLVCQAICLDAIHRPKRSAAWRAPTAAARQAGSKASLKVAVNSPGLPTSLSVQAKSPHPSTTRYPRRPVTQHNAAGTALALPAACPRRSTRPASHWRTGSMHGAGRGQPSDGRPLFAQGPNHLGAQRFRPGRGDVVSGALRVGEQPVMSLAQRLVSGCVVVGAGDSQLSRVGSLDGRDVIRRAVEAQALPVVHVGGHRKWAVSQCPARKAPALAQKPAARQMSSNTRRDPGGKAIGNGRI